jgi:hypothetical protein
MKCFRRRGRQGEWPLLSSLATDPTEDWRAGTAPPRRSASTDGAAACGAAADRQLVSGLGAAAEGPRNSNPLVAPGCIPSLLPVRVLLRACSAASRACAAAPACVLTLYDKITRAFASVWLRTLGSLASPPCSLCAVCCVHAQLPLVRACSATPRACMLCCPASVLPCVLPSPLYMCTTCDAALPPCARVPARLPTLPRRTLAISRPAPTTTYSVLPLRATQVIIPK